MSRKAPRQRKPGLWLDGVRVEVQGVRRAHKLLCEHCGVAPRGRRLFVRRGSGRASVSGVLCCRCGCAYIRALETEAARAIEFLAWGGCDDGEGIRLPERA